MANTDRIAADLRALSYVIRVHQTDVRNLELQRNELIRAALADGWTHAQIAEATGLTRGRIGQLAASKVTSLPDVMP